MGADFSYGEMLRPRVDLYKHTLLRKETVARTARRGGAGAANAYCCLLILGAWLVRRRVHPRQSAAVHCLAK
jgi:hypothetical protein